MTAQSENHRSRAFLLDKEVDLRFRNTRLRDRDFVDDSNDLFLIAVTPMGKRQLMEGLRTRLRAKQIALEGKDYLWAGDKVHTAATSLVRDMLETLEAITSATDKLGVWRVVQRF
tara:strand:- start:176 stop:520 length:345 start_codon:yes stop_codon:yes gene_type:complete